MHGVSHSRNFVSAGLFVLILITTASDCLIEPIWPSSTRSENPEMN